MATRALHAAGQHRSKHDRILCSAAGRDHGPGGMEQHRRRNLLPAGARADPSRHIGRHRVPDLDDALAVRHYLERIERQRGRVDLTQHAAEVPLVRFTRRRPGVHHQLAVGRGGSQLAGIAIEQQTNLVQQCVHGHVVAYDVMVKQRQHVLAPVHIEGGERLQQRCLREVERAALWIADRQQPFPGIRTVRSDLNQTQLCMAVHHLHGLTDPLPVNGGAQNIVPLHQRLQCGEKPLQPLPAVEAQHEPQQVGVITFAQKVVEQNSLLHRRQGVDVLDVVHAAGGGGDDAVDLDLADVRQRHHVWTDAMAAGWNRRALEWYRTGYIRQRLEHPGHVGQGPVGKRTLYIGPPAFPLERGDHLYHQQRMPAQFEEVVLTADALAPQQPGPDAGKLLFGVRDGCFVQSASNGRVVRRRECTPIKLSVFSQRPRVQCHVGTG
ncbi:hypothetical protein CPBF367_38920 [Xanthomonas arboricola pv. juglandis]|nr:hypothetical protein CPBF367_38920 [Xanthomonas arboricola pv. juglandis]